MESLWALEHSQYSEDNDLYPYHVGPLSEAIRGNLQDYYHNNRRENKWQIVYIGPNFESCSRKIEQLEKLRAK